MKKVLVIAVHPDDETLGAGGTILKHLSNGDEVHWLIVTSAHSYPGITKERLSKIDEVIEKVEKAYSFTKVHKLNLPTTQLDNLPKGEIVDHISKVVKEVEPEVMYLPFMNDVHSDHRVVFDAAWSCTKSFRNPTLRKVLMMEALSETEFSNPVDDIFNPNVFSDITDFHEKKLEILKHYESEIGEHPFPRSLESVTALARFRGSTSGCSYAESFMLLKEIN